MYILSRTQLRDPFTHANIPAGTVLPRSFPGIEMIVATGGAAYEPGDPPADAPVASLSPPPPPGAPAPAPRVQAPQPGAEPQD